MHLHSPSANWFAGVTDAHAPMQTMVRNSCTRARSAILHASRPVARSLRYNNTMIYARHCHRNIVRTRWRPADSRLCRSSNTKRRQIKLGIYERPCSVRRRQQQLRLFPSVCTSMYLSVCREFRCELNVCHVSAVTARPSRTFIVFIHTFNDHHVRWHREWTCMRTQERPLELSAYAQHIELVAQQSIRR